MAGLYPDVPSRRMAYDDDGAVGVYFAIDFGDSSTEYLASQMNNLNSEDESTVPGGVGPGQPNHWAAIIFPELREVDGVFVANNGSNVQTGRVETSADTTNARSGTWTERITNFPEWSVVDINYRDEIQSQAISNVRGLRIEEVGVSTKSGANWKALHIYGEISPGETPDRLLFIDELTGLEFVLPVDYADIPRGSSEDLEIRIKNNSAGLTANTIQYTAEALKGDSGGWFTYTLPGGSTYAATQNIASLAAATTTGIIIVRRITPEPEILQLHAARTYLNTASWS